MIISNMKLQGIIILLLSVTLSVQAKTIDEIRLSYPDIINIAQTPRNGIDVGSMLHGRQYHIGLFSDQGSWMGFVPPDKTKSLNGFCGPFSIYNRYWFAQSLVVVKPLDINITSKCHINTAYYPGELQLNEGSIRQSLIFSDASTAIVRIDNPNNRRLLIGSVGVNDNVRLINNGKSIKFVHPSGESVVLNVSDGINLNISGNEYTAETSASVSYVSMTFYSDSTDYKALSLNTIIPTAFHDNSVRWNYYLSKVLRNDMPKEYNRIAVKALVTLISNWRVPRGGLIHQAIVPSHSSDYFVGWWSWDCWRFSAALASVTPKLAEDNIRAIFDYQLADGMVPDCIHVDTKNNNLRDTKPPLCAWAVNEVYKQTHDTAFVCEMYPKLEAYYKWWFAKRDHDHNGICEFGSCDGTLEAAAWESGMDNAIRFDGCVMLKNGDNAWSLNQESIDLNSYLVNEYRCLQKLAVVAGRQFLMSDMSNKVGKYFFDSKIGFFCDRRIGTKNFIEQPGCEGYVPLWTGIASKDQFHKVLKLLVNPNKFSTYIPFPTVAADNPKFNPKGYWRGPIWLDQTYFAISGLRRYGENSLADKYTDQVFVRLKGLTGNAPIYENYDTHTGIGVAEQSNQFSWSAAHLLMLYREYGNKR